MRNRILLTLVLTTSICVLSYGQSLEIEGNGLFISPASTNVDIKNIDDNTNALIRFGDNNIIKASAGFNGNDDAFKISMGTTLGREDFTISESGLIGVNTLPSNHRLLIRHNSVAGTSAHLTLRENNTSDFARLRFDNDGDDVWTLAARATDGSAILNVFHNNGTNFANIMSFDGDLHRVGIHNTSPEAYLHIRQASNSVPALILQNDDLTGAEKWQILVNGDSDLEFQFEGEKRGTFSSTTGAYTAFPPSSSAKVVKSLADEKILDHILKLKPVYYENPHSSHPSLGLDPLQVERINPDWIVKSEDGNKKGINYNNFLILSLRALQEQQQIIDNQEREIEEWADRDKKMDARILEAEIRLAELLEKHK